jgi:acyl dehydratase
MKRVAVVVWAGAAALLMSLANNAWAAADVTSPSVSTVTVQNTGPVSAGDTVTVSVVMSDNVAVSGRELFFVGPANRQVNGSYHSDTDTFTIPVTADMPNGTYQLRYVSASDAAGNTEICYGPGSTTSPYCYDTTAQSPMTPWSAATGSFTVTGNDGADVTSPSVSTVTVQNTGPVSAGDTVTVSVVMSDNVAVSGRELFFVGPANRQVNGSYHSDTDTFTIPVTADMPNGTYQLRYVSASDAAGNTEICYGPGSTTSPYCYDTTAQSPMTPWSAATGSFTVTSRLPGDLAASVNVWSGQNCPSNMFGTMDEGLIAANLPVRLGSFAADGSVSGGDAVLMAYVDYGSSPARSITIPATNGSDYIRADATTRVASGTDNVEGGLLNNGWGISMGPDCTKAVPGRTGTAYLGFALLTSSDEPLSSALGVRFPVGLAINNTGDLHPIGPKVTYDFTAGGAAQFAPSADHTPPTVTVSGGPAAMSNSHSATVAFNLADADDATSSLSTTCQLDGATATPCASPVTYTGLADGAHTLSVVTTDAAGNGSAPLVTNWTVDTAAPTASLTAPTARFTTAAAIPLSWTAADSATGVASKDVRWSFAPYNGTFGAWSQPANLQHLTGQNSSFTPPKRGGTYCFSVRATDGAGNTSAWSPSACTSVPVDDAALLASSKWQRLQATGYFAGTASLTSTVNQTLTLTGVQTRHLALVATSCPGCGTVGVYLNGKLLKTVSLASTATKTQQVISVADWTSIQTGTVTIKTLTSAKPVYVDGLATNRS